MPVVVVSDLEAGCPQGCVSGLLVLLVGAFADAQPADDVSTSLATLPVAPGFVEVFRRIEDVPGVLQEATAVEARTYWLQLGLWPTRSRTPPRARGWT